MSLPNYRIYLKLMIDGVVSKPFSARTIGPEGAAFPEIPKAVAVDSTGRIQSPAASRARDL